MSAVVRCALSEALAAALSNTHTPDRALPEPRAACDVCTNNTKYTAEQW
jgi:hypothetical protein